MLKLDCHFQKSLIKTVYYLSLVALVACNSSRDYRLSPNVIRFTKGAIDARSLVGEKFKIVGDKIRNGKLLLNATAAGDSSFFVVTDIYGKKIETIIKDPTNSYVASSFDCDGERLVCFNSLNANIYLKDLKIPNSRFSVLDNFSPSEAGDIVLNNNQLYLTEDVYGVGLADINRKEHSFFKDTVGINSPLASVASYPLNDSLNILSGQTTAIGKTKLYAIDSTGLATWSYLIEGNKTLSGTDILNFNKAFVIAQNKKLIALNKKGDVLWTNEYAQNIKKAYKVGERALILCVVYNQSFPAEDAPCEILLKLIESKNGAIVWDKYINARGNAPSLAICGDNLLVSDNSRFAVYNLNSGKAKYETTFAKTEKNGYAFTTITDIVTGVNYLKSYDDSYYW